MALDSVRVDVEAITFSAVVYKVQTLVDGGLRLTLDMAETEIDAASWLMRAKRIESLLRVACVAVAEGEGEEDEPT